MFTFSLAHWALSLHCFTEKVYAVNKGTVGADDINADEEALLVLFSLNVRIRYPYRRYIEGADIT